MFNEIHRHNRNSATSRRVLRDPLGGVQDIAGIRAAETAAQNAAQTAAQTAAQYGAQAGALGGMLVPTIESDVMNAPGLSPAQQNAMIGAAEGGLGGAASGLVGEAALAGARSRNVGAGTTGALDEIAREKMRTSAGIGLDVATKNAMLQQQQRANALKQLEGIYGTQTGAQLKAQSLVPEDINAWVNASKSGWLQNVEGVMGAVSGMAGGIGGGMTGAAAMGAHF
jgi:hypothetical protein